MTSNVIKKVVIIYFSIIIFSVLISNKLPMSLAMKISIILPIPFFILIIYLVIKFLILIVVGNKKPFH